MLSEPLLASRPLRRRALQPRKVKPQEDPHRLGLVLEWVYGTIVSTAEKARDGAKRALGEAGMGTGRVMAAGLWLCHRSSTSPA